VIQVAAIRCTNQSRTKQSTTKAKNSLQKIVAVLLDGACTAGKPFFKDTKSTGSNDKPKKVRAKPNPNAKDTMLSLDAVRQGVALIAITCRTAMRMLVGCKLCPLLDVHEEEYNPRRDLLFVRFDTSDHSASIFFYWESR